MTSAALVITSWLIVVFGEVSAQGDSGEQAMPAFVHDIGWLLIVAGVIWTLTWKGIALWKAARLGHVGWFVALLLIHTLGVLEILYLFVVIQWRASHAA